MFKTKAHIVMEGWRNANALYRSDDGTVYAYECPNCNQFWKIYQASYHTEDCIYNKNNPVYKDLS